MPLSTEGLDHSDNKTSIFRQDSGQRIKSGDYFKIQTDDPDKKPLPSFELLELQWFLRRIQGMAGAADIDWPCFSESGWESDENIPGLDLDAIEGSSLLSISIPPSPEDLRKATHNPDNSKHQTIEEERDGDEVGDDIV